MSRHEGGDRRKYHRIDTEQVISFAEIDRPDQLGMGKDVSSGGIRFETVGCEITLGDVLRVTFNVMAQTTTPVATTRRGRAQRCSHRDRSGPRWRG